MRSISDYVNWVELLKDRIEELKEKSNNQEVKPMPNHTKDCRDHGLDYCSCPEFKTKEEKIVELTYLCEGIVPLIKSEYPVLASLIREKLDSLRGDL